MAQPCSICTHPRRGEIDAALIQGSSSRDVGGRFGCSKSAVARHAKDHIAKTIAAAQQALEISHGGNLTEQIRSAKEEVHAVLDAARGKDPKIVLAAVGKLQGLLELLAKIDGKLQDGVTINLSSSPEWSRTREIILQALAPFPDARIAVASALQLSAVPHAHN
jgi:hypothetical protein